MAMAKRVIPRLAVLQSLQVLPAAAEKQTREASSREGPGFRAWRAGAVSNVRGGGLVDAARPAAPQRVDDLERQASDAGDLQLDVVAVLECTQALVVGSH